MMSHLTVCFNMTILGTDLANINIHADGSVKVEYFCELNYLRGVSNTSPVFHTVQAMESARISAIVALLT